MDETRDQVPFDRLCDAAEAALAAALDVERHTGKPAPYPADLLGSALQPAVLDQFTRFEIEQASEFLVRLGMIPKPMTRRA